MFCVLVCWFFVCIGAFKSLGLVVCVRPRPSKELSYTSITESSIRTRLAGKVIAVGGTESESTNTRSSTFPRGVIIVNHMYTFDTSLRRRESARVWSTRLFNYNKAALVSCAVFLPKFHACGHLAFTNRKAKQSKAKRRSATNTQLLLSCTHLYAKSTCRRSLVGCESSK